VRRSGRDVINVVTSGQVWSVGRCLSVRAATIESVSTEMWVGWRTPQIISTIRGRYTVSTASELRLLYQLHSIHGAVDCQWFSRWFTTVYNVGISNIDEQHTHLIADSVSN